jgi:hypothetical protein
MRDQHVDALGAPAVERHAERPDAGAGIEDEQGVVGGVDGDARRLAAVTNRLGAGGGERAAATPDRRAHRG